MSTADEIIARSAWAAAVPADATPGRAWLAACRHWPPAGIGPDLPDEAVRWLPRELADDFGVSLPHGAAGALVYAWGQIREAECSALRYVPLTDDAQPGPWFGRDRSTERIVGSLVGRVFALTGPNGRDTTFVESEVDALAVTLSGKPPGLVVAVTESRAALEGMAGYVAARVTHTLRETARMEHGDKVVPLGAMAHYPKAGTMRPADMLADTVDTVVRDFAAVEPDAARLAAAWRAVLAVVDTERRYRA